MNIYGFLMTLVVFLAFIVFEILNFRRIEKLLNRIMSINYQEYRYYEEKWGRDLKTVDKLREQQFDTEAKEAQKPKPDLSVFEDFKDEAEEV
jgi:hypothetical protein